MEGCRSVLPELLWIECFCPPQIHILIINVMVFGGEGIWEVIRVTLGDDVEARMMELFPSQRKSRQSTLYPRAHTQTAM